MNRAVLLGLLVASGCGKVSAVPDAATMDDAAIDAPPVQVVTGIAVHGVTTFAAPLNVLTKVQFSGEVYDDENEFDPTTNRYTARAAGDYLVCAGLASVVQGIVFELDLYINSVRDKAIGFGSDVARGCRIVRIAAGDYIEIWMNQETAASLTVVNNLVHDWLTITRMAAPSVAAGTSAAFNVDATFVTLPYANEQRDELNAYSPTTNALTPPQGGDYFVCASVAYGGAFDGELDVFKNNVRVVGLGHGNRATRGCRTTRLAATETVDVRFSQSSGTSKSIPHDSIWNWLTVYSVPVNVQVNNTSAFSTMTAQFVKIPYTGEAFDVNGEFDVGTSTFTAASAGDYLMCSSFDDRAATQVSEVDMYKNGDRFRSLSFGIGAQTGCQVVRLAANEQIDFRIYATTTGAVAMTPDPTWQWLQVSKLR